jgi:hypothetical protein
MHAGPTCLMHRCLSGAQDDRVCATPTPHPAESLCWHTCPPTLSSTILLCALETPALFESTWDAIIV